MGRGNRLSDPNSGMQAQTPHRWERRNFVQGVAALVGAAGLSAHDMRSAAAEPPPEITKLRIHESTLTCIAPTIIARELLYAEGFTDVQFVRYLKDTHLWPPEAFLAGDADIGFSFSPTDVRFIDAGAPLAILGAAHVGCVELVASDRVRSTRDLKGKPVGITSDTKFFISMFAAYVGLDPEKDINWVPVAYGDRLPFFTQGKIEAFMCSPPFSLELRQKKIGHVLVNTTTDKPWAQYSCCLIAATKDFVRKYPVATKRALRAFLKSVDLCVAEPSRVARFIADRWAVSYDITLQGLREVPYAGWREIDVADSLRFWALRMHDVGAIKSSPQQIIAQGIDLRFLNELK